MGVAAAAEIPDVTSGDEPDGCIGDTGHRIIKAVVIIILEYLIDKWMKRL